MRFEQMTFSQQVKALERLYKFLNKEAFNNYLKMPKMDIENLSKEDDVYGAYRRPTEYKAMLENGELIDVYPERIAISLELEEDAAKAKTQKDQAVMLGEVILHEMVHQFCYAAGIDDTNHNENFAFWAGKFGICFICEGCEELEEYMEFAIRQGFRL